MATRIKAENTVASKTHVFSYVQQPLRSERPERSVPWSVSRLFVTMFRPLKNKELSWVTKALNSVVLEPVVEGATVPSSFGRMETGESEFTVSCIDC